jgi:hypothetical protein
VSESEDHSLAAGAQLLATEHWGLLASRSTTQSEVLSRISMFLTLVSAGLVSIALVGQATAFDSTFALFAVVVLAFISLVGFLTQLRVTAVGMEDLMYVLAMNRLRAAYTAIAPAVAPYLMASPYDDRLGSRRTYDFLGLRGGPRHVAGSSFVFIMAVEAALIGLLAAAVTRSATSGIALAVLIGVVAGLLYLLVSMWFGYRDYERFWATYRPLNPTPGSG